MTEHDLMQSMAAYAVPQHLRRGLVMWIMNAVEPGGFMVSVLENDLRGAVCKADAQSLAGLGNVVKWLIAEAPGACWGNEGKNYDWAASGGWINMDETARKMARFG